MSVVAIIGLGYVGLPLAIEFGKHFRTIGFDISEEKISKYRIHHDPTGEVSKLEFQSADKLLVTGDSSALAEADFIIIAVPTPVDSAHSPNFGPLISASEIAGKQMKRGAVVIYESTVYPGATEEICVPILEKFSGFVWKDGFHVGYSPERVNPGDKEHTLPKIVKIVSGDDVVTLEKVAALYGSVITAGLHRASSIKVAEAAKVIENTQRDLNISLVNELAIIFHRMDIDTQEVLQAAGTKWNFLPFHPGLVGGHCIGVDPYYLTSKAETLGYHPQVILAGRRINDSMGKYVAEQTVKLMIQNGVTVRGGTINILGLTFKEDCPDLRNSKVVDVINELKSYGANVFVHDPVADPDEAVREYGIELAAWQDLPVANALIFAVPHIELVSRPLFEIATKLTQSGCLIDVKAKLNKDLVKAAGLKLWRL